MFANISNSSDMSLWEGFHKQFGVEQLKFVQYSPQCPFGPPLLESDDLSVYLQFCYNRMCLVPDGVVRFSNVQIVSQSDTDESKICCDFHVDATMVYDVPSNVLLPPDMVIVSLDDNSGRVTNYNNCGDNNVIKKRKLESKKHTKLRIQERTDLFVRGAECDHIDITAGSGGYVYDNTVVDVISTAPLLPSPVSFEVNGKVTMFLDVNKLIKKLLFEQNVFCL